MTDNYRTEDLSTRITPKHERRIRDFRTAPKRRVTDPKAVKAAKADYVSPREQELFDLIDGHIIRLNEEKAKAQQ